MASYKYKIGGEDQKIRVKYNISPDIIGTPSVGTQIYIYGVVQCYDVRYTNVTIDFSCGDVNEYSESFSTGVSVTQNESVNFNLSFPIGVILQGYRPYASAFSPNFGENSERVYIEFAGIDKNGSRHSTGTNENQYLIYKNSDNRPVIDDLQLSRVKLVDGKYVSADDGNRLMIHHLKATSQDVADNRFVWFQITPSYDRMYIDDIDHNTPEEEAIFSDTGYTEITPVIFESEVLLSASYEIKLVVSDGKGHDSASITINKSFANLHLSGAKNGGVCCGGFSGSTDDEPKFESYYKGYFYNGFDETTIKLIGNILYPVGSIYMNTDSIDPQTIFGGKWSPIAGRFLLGAGTPSGDSGAVTGVSVGTKGGDKSVSIGNHRHRSPVARNGKLFGLTTTGAQSATGDIGNIIATSGQTGGSYSGVTIYNTGAAGSHTVNTVPPYLGVSMWERTQLYNPEDGA